MTTKNNEWISVNETLPMLDGWYLCYCPSYSNPYVIWEYDADLGAFTEDWEEVTHWQPLPEKPKEN
ncbi:DUF551 domain-containing protein [Rodentibacter haemolyticus]|uniref:DUF551 domain-containing protein n=1 Tax=Rodentibacter haemolyticus TaxID=2778911 RepID=A0ABX6UXJ8_9PAST|nr:DUF551 domain-containing protein [Rodentibacter haemolyticus]QPB42179.1 DUF551 domain-containing protein [Rodentibacter haemolyticus]